MKGQAQTRVTLHHYICVHICASVAALPPVYLPVLVRPYIANYCLSCGVLCSVLVCYLPASWKNCHSGVYSKILEMKNRIVV